MRKGILADFLIPLLAALAVTGGIDLAGADLAVQSLFYSPGQGWALGNREPWAFLYHFGNLPALALGAMAGIAFGWSFFSARFRTDRMAALFVVAFLALGPGLTVNTVFKDHWGRPRPADSYNLAVWKPTGRSGTRAQRGREDPFLR